MKQKHRITVNPLTPEAAKIIADITANGRPEGATAVYEGPRNKLYFINNPDVSPTSAAHTVNVKDFRIPPFPNNYIYSRFRPGKAARSYEFANRLIELGFNTPFPLGFSEVHEGLQLTRSYYFTTQVSYPNIRFWEGKRNYNDFVAALGAEIARLHAAGVWMKDFSTGNILFDEHPDGTFTFYYVDLNRTEFGVTDPRKLMQMFKALSCSRDCTADIAKAYAIAAGKDVDATLADALAVFDNFQRRQQRKASLKKFLKF